MKCAKKINYEREQNFFWTILIVFNTLFRHDSYTYSHYNYHSKLHIMRDSNGRV